MPRQFKGILIKIGIPLFFAYTLLFFFTTSLSLPRKSDPISIYASELKSDLRLVYLKVIARAKESISLQMYGLSDPDLISLLKKKALEGISVQVFYDPKGSPPDSFGRPIQTSGLMHRKILVIDHALTLVGTANFTPNSLTMHANLVCAIASKPIASFFERADCDGGQFLLGSSKIEAFYLPDFEKKAIARLKEIIDCAKSKICLAMFTLTHQELITHLIEAKKRGVKVEVALDRYTAKGASAKAAQLLKDGGIEIFTTSHRGLLHHKWVWIDDQVLALGSTNWTLSAFKKNQDCLLIFDPLPKREKEKMNTIWKRLKKRGDLLE